MKTFVFVLTFVFTSIAFSSVALAQEALNMSEPPFIMSSYDEFNDMQKEQKDAYLKDLELAFKDIPALKVHTSEKLTEASEWYPSWDLIRKSVYEYCQENIASKNCEKITDLRIKALDSYSVKPLDLSSHLAP